MDKKQQLTLLFGFLFIFFAFVIPYMLMQKVSSREELEALILSWGSGGMALYTLIGIVCTVLLPLNFTLVGLAGGFAYGTGLSFLLLWTARIVGNSINFYLGRRYGRNILNLFINEEKIHKYDALLNSEKALLLYFILCFLPGFPGDYAAYFLGSSRVKKPAFLLVTVTGNIGCAFTLAYTGSGQAFTDPLFLCIFFVLFLSGISWIHKLRKKLKLT